MGKVWKVCETGSKIRMLRKAREEDSVWMPEECVERRAIYHNMKRLGPVLQHTRRKESVQSHCACRHKLDLALYSVPHLVPLLSIAGFSRQLPKDFATQNDRTVSSADGIPQWDWLPTDMVPQ